MVENIDQRGNWQGSVLSTKNEDIDWDFSYLVLIECSKVVGAVVILYQVIDELHSTWCVLFLLWSTCTEFTCHNKTRRDTSLSNTY